MINNEDLVASAAWGIGPRGIGVCSYDGCITVDNDVCLNVA